MIGFEVFEDGIICFCFTDYCHFQDYDEMPAEGENFYVIQAIQFLNRLFTWPMKYTYTKRGKKLRGKNTFSPPEWDRGTHRECLFDAFPEGVFFQKETT